MVNQSNPLAQIAALQQLQIGSIGIYIAQLYINMVKGMVDIPHLCGFST